MPVLFLGEVKEMMRNIRSLNGKLIYTRCCMTAISMTWCIFSHHWHSYQCLTLLFALVNTKPCDGEPCIWSIYMRLSPWRVGWNCPLGTSHMCFISSLKLYSLYLLKFWCICIKKYGIKVCIYLKKNVYVVCLVQSPVFNVCWKCVKCICCLRVCTLSLSPAEVAVPTELISQVFHISS